MGLSAGTKPGPYEILAPHGTGGMGDVYRIPDTRLDRDVAFKVLQEQLFEDREGRERFRWNARDPASHAFDRSMEES